MLRALKFLSIILVATVTLASEQSVNADDGGYVIGKFSVTGFGDHPTESKANANALMEAKIAEVTASLPEGHQVEAVAISNEGWLGPFQYYIDFKITVMSNPPPSPPGG